MPFIYPPLPSGPMPVSGGAKQGRQSLHGEYAVQEDVDQGYDGNAVFTEDNGRWDDEEDDSDDDYTMKTRLPRMSFDGHPYPPIPPDASTFPRPTDDWFTQPIQNAQAPRGKPGPVRMPTSHLQATPSQFSDSYQPHAYGTFQRPLLPTEFAHTTHPPHHEQVFAWSPSYADPAAQPAGYRAPMLHPRHIHLPQRPITPHDTYRYPVSHGEHIYVAPAIAVEGPTKETINSAFAYWYVDQVIGLLVKPGQYRPGVGGASSEIWGLGGRETDGWIRMGRPPPDYSKSWGRMGMTATPLPVPRRLRFRTPETEPRDPWNVLWNNHPKRSSSLVTFVLDMLQRMTISPTAVVAGVWFLTGLGLHEGDGQKGAELREMLSEQKWSDLEAVEKRVATLGLLLAGKWLDDNSFLTKSWSEVTSIPVKQIDRMERAALKDLYFSLRVPVSSWVDHVNKLFTSLNMKDAIDEVDSVTIPILDHMVTEARDAEMRIPRLVASPVDRGRRLSAQELPAAADQALSRDWGTFVRTYAINDGVQAPEPHWPRSKDPEAERAVSALVDDMDEDEEFLDYDGAKRWLPSLSEVRRSASHSSVHSVDSFADVDNWRSAVRPDAQRSSLVSSNSRNSWDSQAYYPDDSVSYPSYTNSTGTMPFEYHTKSCPQCGCERHCDASSKAQAPIQTDYATPSSTHRDTAVFLEPGISIIRPPISANPRVAATSKWELHPPKWR